jgi:hypothetical protein
VFENRVLRKRGEVTGDGRKLHNEELLCCMWSPRCKSDQIKENEMGRACGMQGEQRNACSILVGKCEGKRALGRLRHYEATVLMFV